jgi:superfamily II DNA or RNA helicase
VSVIHQLRGDFPRIIREKGHDYFRRNAVEIVETESNRIRARVKGTHLYEVKIDWGDDGFNYHCTCPFFQDRDVSCKHLWATLLVADARGLLPKSSPRGFAQEDDEDEPRDHFDREFKTIKVGNRTMTFMHFRDKPAAPRKARLAIWRRRLSELRDGLRWREPAKVTPWPADKQIVYVIESPQDLNERGLCIQLSTRELKKPHALKRLRLDREGIRSLPEAIDRQILAMLGGVAGDEYGYWDTAEVPARVFLRSTCDNGLLRMMCESGRCLLRQSPEGEAIGPIQWDPDEPWSFHLMVVPHEAGKTYRLEGSLRRGSEQIAISQPELIIEGGPVFIGQKAAALEDFGAFALVELLRSDDRVIVPMEQADELVKELLEFPRLPRLELAKEMGITEERLPPRPRLMLSPPGKTGESTERLRGRLSFGYGAETIDHEQPAPAVFDSTRRRIVQRDFAAESQAQARLRELGFRLFNGYGNDEHEWRLLPRLLPAAVRALTAEHWHVEVSGKVYRQPGSVQIRVSSGIDWFELDGQAEFEGKAVPLPALLRAISKGQSTIVLDDGTMGILPEDWLSRYGLLAAVAQVKDETIQFAPNQVGLLDALLAQMPTDFDEAFCRARDELRRFEGVKALDPPNTFVGTLRPYQRDGLGWLDFLRVFGLNGCLADDMGLGKTVQVLAMLEERRRQGTGPSLVVVPRSLVFNWHQEAARFTPKMRVLDHAGADRLRGTDHFRKYDLVLSTYGTLRRDVSQWTDMRFDYVILDEAQAIKNAASESAKAARLLRANHRLALSGTPVQNHLGELWSLLDFLNPGMLGATKALAALTSADRNVSPETRQFLANALRPFILRRTKEQVAQDLPEKFEQTIFCDLDKRQRALYDELKEHYRQSLLGRIDREGLGKSKLQILEALLRLRQAACHPGLLNKSQIDDGSAKLDTLLPRLAEVAAEGHKAIVFSQFTSLLAIVRKRLDEKETVYEYLDGKTRDRQEKVERFQNDPNCRLFLVSLKAGGLGLNLTAAQYVFLLDPWWNPAVEAQAIDRAHRIGQTRQVFAYRLIARDTVEEKVLALQQSKRELADAIINADNAILSKLRREDLELLLS